MYKKVQNKNKLHGMTFRFFFLSYFVINNRLQNEYLLLPNNLTVDVSFLY